ncbi:MAG: hypothetical protein ACI9HK_002076 [Pirellulaceae bacterium]|jgi:hypothetical protein
MRNGSIPEVTWPSDDESTAQFYVNSALEAFSPLRLLRQNQRKLVIYTDFTKNRLPAILFRLD